MDWSRLADAIRRRRLGLDRGQAEVAKRSGLTPVTVSRAENGHPMSQRTLWKLDRGLDWQPGSAESVAKGGEPTEVDASGVPMMLAPDERSLWESLPDDLSDERRMELIAEFRQLRAAQRAEDEQRQVEEQHRPAG